MMEKFKLANLDKRDSGIEVIGEVPWGTHFCLFYQTKEDLIDILVPYFKAGLENNEYCMWVTSEPLNQNDAENAIRKAIPNFEQYLNKKQIEIIPHSEWYLKNNEFNSQRVLDGWIDKLNYGLSQKFKGLRLTGNTFWLEEKDWKAFTDYEEEVNNIIGNYNMIGICTYSLEKCGPYELLDVIHNHQFALIRREGKWTNFKSIEQIKTEEKLKETELRYRTTFEQSPDGIMIVDPETTRAIEFNTAMCNMLGYSREEFAGLLVPDYDANEDPSDTRAHVEKVMREGREDFETKMRTKDGNVKYIHVIAKVIELSGKKYFQSICRDITKRKKAEQKLKESEAKLKVAIESLPFPFYILDGNGQYTMQNTTAKKVWGDLIGKRPKDIANDEDTLALWLSNNSRVFSGETLTNDAEYDLNGDIRYFYDIVAPVYIDNKVQNIIGVNIDITERKKAEQKLKESEEKWRALSENSPANVMLLDLEQKILFINRTVPDLSIEEVIGKSIYNFFPREYHQVAKECYNSVIKTGKPSAYTANYVSKEGDISFFDVWIGPIFDSGKIIALISHSLDVTERKKAEQKLIESEEKYREAFNLVNFYKDLFSHDMNNILQAINSSVEYYALFKKDPEKLQKLGEIDKVVKTHLKRGSNLVLNVRKLSKLEESETQLRSIEIFEVLNQSVNLAMSGFQDRNAKIDVSGLSKGMKVLGNELLIDIFDNLLNNAVKYNDNDDAVKAEVYISKINENGTLYIKFEFKDYGMGVTDEKKGYLFERSYSRDISQRGMGMGLSLVKKIVDKYGGKIWVENRIEGDYRKGSNFVLLLKEVS